MKIPALLFSALMAAAASAAAAPQALMDFDGSAAAGGKTGARDGGSLFSSLEAAAAELPKVSAPVPAGPARYDLPPPDPSCNIGPDGGPCGQPGNNNNTQGGSNGQPSGGQLPGGSPGHSSGGGSVYYPWGNAVITPEAAKFDLERTFVAYVCARQQQISSSSCRSKSGRLAAVALAREIAKDLIASPVEARIALYFPGSLPYIATALALQELYKAAIDMAQIDMTELVNKSVSITDSMSPAEKARRMRMIVEDEKSIKEWKRAAIIEANSGKSWEEISTNVYSLKEGGPAAQQLRQALLSNELLRGPALNINVSELMAE